jgi:hypothetical protein
MATVRIEQVFDCDEETFWRELFFDPDFNRKMFLEHLRFDGWELDRYDDDEEAIDRLIRVKPVTGPLPGPIKKVVGDNLGYREEGRYDKKTKRYRFRVIPNTRPDKVSIDGEIHVEPRDGKVARILDLEVKVKLFGVGGLIEKRIIEDTKKSYDDSYGYMQKHLESLA